MEFKEPDRLTTIRVWERGGSSRDRNRDCSTQLLGERAPSKGLTKKNHEDGLVRALDGHAT